MFSLSPIFSQDLQRHRKKLRPTRVADVTRNRAFTDSEGRDNVTKVKEPVKFLEYVIGQEESFQNSGEMGEGQRAKEEDAPWLAPQAKLTLNPVYGNYEAKELIGESSSSSSSLLQYQLS